MWDYAALSQAAKLEGGPEALVSKLLSDGISRGRAEMIPWIFGALGVGSLITAGIYKGVKFLKEKQERQIQKTKQEIIDGIKAYDKEQEDLAKSYECVSNNPEPSVLG